MVTEQLSLDGLRIPGAAQHQDQMRLIMAVLPWGWNSPEQSWHSLCGQPTPLPPWILLHVHHLNLSGLVQLMLRVFGSLFLTTSLLVVPGAAVSTCRAIFFQTESPILQPFLMEQLLQP